MPYTDDLDELRSTLRVEPIDDIYVMVSTVTEEVKMVFVAPDGQPLAIYLDVAQARSMVAALTEALEDLEG